MTLRMVRLPPRCIMRSPLSLWRINAHQRACLDLPRSMRRKWCPVLSNIESVVWSSHSWYYDMKCLHFSRIFQCLWTQGLSQMLRFVHSFGIPFLKLSYLLSGYSSTFSQCSMCRPSKPPRPCTTIFIRLSVWFEGWSPLVSHHIPPPNSMDLMYCTFSEATCGLSYETMVFE